MPWSHSQESGARCCFPGIRSKAVKKLFLLLLPLFLSGCVLSPGLTMSSRPHERVPTAQGVLRAEYVPITAELIARMREEAESRARAARALPETAYEQYRIGPRDILSITVWEHPELTIPAGQYRSADMAGQMVDEEGYLYYPYVGRVRVAGMTTNEVRVLLTQRLARYIEKPQLDVRVVAYRSKRVHVLGEVAAPGAQPINDVPMSVAELISRCGGLTEQADMRRIRLTRDGETLILDLLAFYQQGDAAHNLLLQDGDVVYVPSIQESKVFVLGEVPRPGGVPMLRGRMSLSEALSEAGGVSQTSADPGRIYVIRREHERTPRIFRLDADTADALLLADAFEMQPRDIVFVDSARLSRWNRVISQILPSAILLETGRDAARR